MASADVPKPKRGKRKGPVDDLVATNRRARRHYDIRATLECGIELLGSEVKSLRARMVSISDAYAIVKDAQLFLVGLKINRFRHQSTHTAPAQGRTRKLLAHKREIEELAVAIKQHGCSVVPLQIYFKGSLAKVLVGVGTGKTFYDRREDIREREASREMARAITRLGSRKVRDRSPK